MSYKKIVKDTIIYCEDVIFSEYRLRLHPKVIYELKGLKNGQAIGYTTINLNKKLFELLVADDVVTIVKHEYAHLVVEAIKHNLIKENIEATSKLPHGKLWRKIMRLLGIAKPKSVELYEYAAQAYGSLCTYKCACRTYFLTKNRINKIQRGAIYICNKCGEELVQIANELKL